jgi:hypothetical protein
LINFQFNPYSIGVHSLMLDLATQGHGWRHFAGWGVEVRRLAQY